jgi:CMP/dCMP kinase
VEPRNVITIDGPAGAGKSTVGRRLAQSLGHIYLDSGALYRAVAWQTQRLGLDLDDADALARFLDDFRPDIRADAAGFRLFIDGVEVTAALRTDEVGRGASRVAKLHAVRAWVNRQLRQLSENRGVVAEGRDQGTVVFPDAAYKFYLDAREETRAERRLQELERLGKHTELAAIRADMAARDSQDRSRAEAPLAVPQGAIIIDSTNLGIDEVVDRCLSEIKARAKKGTGEEAKSCP